MDTNCSGWLNFSVRTREYLTTAEIERLMAAARKSSRYGHRDATMILIGYRHGLRASELCDLQWSQVELTTGRLHVRRAKNGSPSVHPTQGDEIRLHDRAGRAYDAQSLPCAIRSDRGSRQNAVSDKGPLLFPSKEMMILSVK
jgi:integrase